MTDSKDLVKQASTEVAQPISSNDILNQIVALAQDPDKAGAIKDMADLAMTMQDREAERRFRMAKHDAVMEMPTITKTGAITVNNTVRSRYSKFEDIDRIVRPILSKHRLIITFNVNHEGQMVTVQPILSYADGEMAYEEKGGEMVLAVDTTGSKNATQGAGSAASYGKRHSMKAMLNIIEDGEDNDGQTKVELSEEQKLLINNAREQAKGGTDDYAKWFEGLPQDQKGFLAYTPGPDGVAFHQRNKEAAKLYDQ